MFSWLSYVNYGRDVSPAPGPIKNHLLLKVNYDKECFEPKEGLKLSRGADQGQYRLVSEEAWHFFEEWYPNSGPVIKCRFNEVLYLDCYMKFICNPLSF